VPGFNKKIGLLLQSRSIVTSDVIYAASYSVLFLRSVGHAKGEHARPFSGFRKRHVLS